LGRYHNLVIDNCEGQNLMLHNIDKDDFIKVGGKPEHEKVEELLEAIGGDGFIGLQFKNDVIKACGWKPPKPTPYAKHPKFAAQVFNKIIEALNQTKEKEKLLKILKISL